VSPLWRAKRGRGRRVFVGRLSIADGVSGRLSIADTGAYGNAPYTCGVSSRWTANGRRDLRSRLRSAVDRQRGSARNATACCVGARSTIPRTTSAARTATGTIRTIVTRTTACGWWCPRFSSAVSRPELWCGCALQRVAPPPRQRNGGAGSRPRSPWRHGRAGHIPTALLPGAPSRRPWSRATPGPNLMFAEQTLRVSMSEPQPQRWHC